MSTANNEASKRYRERHPDKRKETTRKYREANKDKIAKSGQQYYLSNKERVRQYFLKYNITEAKFKVHIKNRYGLSIEDYLKMYEDQGGVCKICSKPDKEGVRLSVDHNHTTGKVRGLLCRLCNRAIGLLRDDPVLVAKAAKYLESYANG